jgi:hypothetical protein
VSRWLEQHPRVADWLRRHRAMAQATGLPLAAGSLPTGCTP